MLLNQIRAKLRHRAPDSAQPCGEDCVREAAVLMAITAGNDPEVVFIKRADSLGNHGGQVAFPGGMWEPQDQDLIQTALRESKEEIALPPEQVEIIAALEPIVTRFAVRVSPFVGVIPEGLAFIPELAELDAVFQVPVSHLLDTANYGMSRFSTVAGIFEAPCIVYESYEIWGITYGVIVDMLAEVYGFDPGLNRESVAVDSL